MIKTYNILLIYILYFIDLYFISQHFESNKILLINDLNPRSKINVEVSKYQSQRL